MESTIKINAEREGNYSVLKESFHNAPYKLTHYGSPRAQKHLEMIIMSASPGIMDGDILTIDVNVKEDVHFKLFTQSFNKLHPMKNGAYQNTHMKLSPRSMLHYVPHPVTPFKDAIFYANSRIDMATDATLIWGDIIAAGRIYMDEAFQFEKLHSRTEIFREGKLILTDNQCLMPKVQPIQKLLFFESYTHQATFMYSGPWAKAMKAEFDEILSGEYEDIAFGFTYAAENTLLLRALGNDGELLYNFLSMLGQMCWEFTLHEQAKLKELLAHTSEVDKAERQVLADSPTEAPVKVKKGRIKKQPAA
ncbi:urease accessory protein UreD [Sphingobacterium deserti]|uniref:Urease accessory protein UreD n=1 Tax=Sphingobacterium deserti TaxID=1229276 RepID=A0A0B8T4V5_9SPHI|nr:urease accessory protein UreD [Sphingobacterium deserti]KGE12309.1 urease accessory protein UreD [Sphingobacterium deserti]